MVRMALALIHPPTLPLAGETLIPLIVGRQCHTDTDSYVRSSQKSFVFSLLVWLTGVGVAASDVCR